MHWILFDVVEHNGFTDKKLVSKAVSAFFDRYLKVADAADSSPLPFSRKLIGRYDVL